MQPIIQVENLSKTFQVVQRRPGVTGALMNLLRPRYQAIEAVTNVNFTMQEGEIVGYLGPNGAGKSTTIKMLTGLLTPTRGQARVDGFIPWKERQKYVQCIGAVFGQRTTLWWDLPVIESLELARSLYRIPASRFQRNLDEFIAVLDMASFLNTPVRSLSLGQRMRADLCAALLHEPRLLFLDEPTIGLDVVAKEKIRQFIQHVNRERRATVLLTTHDLSDVEKLCERIIILDHGRVLYDGTLVELSERFESTWSLVVDFEGEYASVDLPRFPPPQRDGLRATYAFDHRQSSASELIQQLLPRFRITDLQIQRPALEDTIRRIYEEKLLVRG